MEDWQMRASLAAGDGEEGNSPGATGKRHEVFLGIGNHLKVLRESARKFGRKLRSLPSLSSKSFGILEESEFCPSS